MLDIVNKWYKLTFFLKVEDIELVIARAFCLSNKMKIGTLRREFLRFTFFFGE